jgi:hypothetical protein
MDISVSPVLQSSSFETTFGQWMFRIRRKHRLTKVCSFEVVVDSLHHLSLAGDALWAEGLGWYVYDDMQWHPPYSVFWWQVCIWWYGVTSSLFSDYKHRYDFQNVGLSDCSTSRYSY